MLRRLAALLAFAFAVSAVGYCPCRLSASVTHAVGATDAPPRDRVEHRCCRHSHPEPERRPDAPDHKPCPDDSGCACRPLDAVVGTGAERAGCVADATATPAPGMPDLHFAFRSPQSVAGLAVDRAFHPSGRCLLQFTRVFRC